MSLISCSLFSIIMAFVSCLLASCLWHLPFAFCLLPFVFCILPFDCAFVSCLSPIVFCLLPFVSCLSPFVFCLLPLSFAVCLLHLPLAFCLFAFCLVALGGGEGITKSNLFATYSLMLPKLCGNSGTSIIDLACGGCARPCAARCFALLPQRRLRCEGRVR